MSSVSPHLTLKDLPLELWYDIFALARGGDFDPDSDPFAQEWQDAHLDLDTIRNLRLTCRAFRDIADEFLLRRLDVCLTPSSLDHVKKVTQSPSIARGICAVRLNLDCYFETFTGQQRFASLVAITLGRQERQVFDVYNQYLNNLGLGAARDREQEAWFESNGLTMEPPLHASDIRTMRLSFMWIQIACLTVLMRALFMTYGTVSMTEDVANIEAGHERYVDLFREQEKVFQDETLIKVLTAAMKVMPRLRRLVITDDQKYLGEQKQPWPAMVKDSRLLMQREFLRPRRWSELIVPEDLHQQGAPDSFPTFLLHALPLAAKEAGRSLTHLDIRLSAAGAMDWQLPTKDVLGLGKSAASLKTFRCLVDADDRLQEGQFSAFLHAFAGGNRLETYQVALTRAPSPPHVVTVGPLLASLSSENLVKVWISGCSFHLDDLKAYAAKLGTKLQSLTLRNTNMLSGTIERAREVLEDSATQLVVQEPTAV